MRRLLIRTVAIMVVFLSTTEHQAFAQSTVILTEVQRYPLPSYLQIRMAVSDGHQLAILNAPQPYVFLVREGTAVPLPENPLGIGFREPGVLEVVYSDGAIEQIVTEGPKLGNRVANGTIVVPGRAQRAVKGATGWLILTQQDSGFGLWSSTSSQFVHIAPLDGPAWLTRAGDGALVTYLQSDGGLAFLPFGAEKLLSISILSRAPSLAGYQPIAAIDAGGGLFLQSWVDPTSDNRITLLLDTGGVVRAVQLGEALNLISSDPKKSIVHAVQDIGPREVIVYRVERREASH